VFRWIKAGRISATKAEDGTYRIDPAELQRYLDSVTVSPLTVPLPEQPEEQSVAPPKTSDETLLRERNASLEAEIAGLKALLEAERRRFDDERRRSEEIKIERDRWHEQAQRLALAPPAALRVSLWRRMFG
jgi:hypothetical protein